MRISGRLVTSGDAAARLRALLEDIRRDLAQRRSADARSGPGAGGRPRVRRPERADIGEAGEAGR